MAGHVRCRRTAVAPVGCVIVRDGEIVGAGATGPFPVGPHAEVAALARRRRPGSGCHRLHDARAVRPPRQHPAVHRGADRRRRRTRRDRGRSIPTPRSPVAGSTGSAPRASPSTVGTGADGVEHGLAPYLHQRRTGRAFTRAQDRDEPRRAHRRGRRHEPVDHERRGPRRRPPAPRRVARRARRPGHRDRRPSGLTVRDVRARAVGSAAPRAARRARAACPSTGRSPTRRSRPPSSTPPTGMPAATADAWRAAGADVSGRRRG